MPSTVKETKWFVRVDSPHEHIRNKMKEILGWIGIVKLLAVLHNGEKGDNPHVHFVMELKEELQKQSLDVRIKKLFGVSGRGSYSSKPWDGGDGACSYMFHESDDMDNIVTSKGFTETDVKKFKELNKKTQEVIAINKEKASGRVVERILSIAQPEWTRLDIGYEILRRVREGEIYEPGDFQLRKYIEEIYMKMRTDEEFESYAMCRLNQILNL